jgi:hypothetical protein
LELGKKSHENGIGQEHGRIVVPKSLPFGIGYGDMGV